MLKTEAERRAAADHIVGDMALEGLKPSPMGSALMERVIKGEMSAEEALRLLGQHYKGEQGDVAGSLSVA